MKMGDIICLETDAKKLSVASPTLDSFLKLPEWSRQWAHYMDHSVMDFVERARDLYPEGLLAKNASYRKHQQRKQKVSRPSLSTTQVEKDEKMSS